MKNLQFSKCLRIILLLAMLIFNFGASGIIIVQADVPNDLFANATPINSLPFNESYDTTGAHTEFNLTPPEPDPGDYSGGCEGKLLRDGLATVWYSYQQTSGSTTPVFISTAGSTTSVPNPNDPPLCTPGVNCNPYEYDTYLAVYTGTSLNDLILFACNDNPENSTNQAELAFNAASGTTYYIQVAEYNGVFGDQNANPGYNGGNLVFSVNTGNTISGNTAGLGGVKLTYAGGATTSNSNGDYTLPIPTNFTGKVKPSKSGYLFAPPIKPYTNVTTNKTGENYNLYSVSPADFNGDHLTDVAVFRPSEGTWYVSGVGPTLYGQAGDVPVPADYNGDGKDDMAVFRPTNNTWYIKGQGSFAYGTFGDIPVVADYDGNGTADIAVFRPSNSTWYISGQGSFLYGTIGDIPVVADYDGDGKANIAVFRPTNSTWYLYGIGPRVYGMVGDIPVIADYTGDGKADIAVFRPTNSTWYIYGVGPKVYGMIGDIPAIGDYNGDGKADITVFRPSNSTWYKYGVGPSVYGTVGDIPV